jgi:hypothetical protein
MLRFGHANDDSDRGTHCQDQKDKGYLDLTFKVFVKLWGGHLLALSHTTSPSTLFVKSPPPNLVMIGWHLAEHNVLRIVMILKKNNLFSEV